MLKRERPEGPAPSPAASRRARLATALVAVLCMIAGTLVATSAPAAAATYSPPSLRQRVDLNNGWKFTKSNPANAQTTSFDDSGWQSVNTPHTWNAGDGANGGGYYRGVGWYRRHYTVPSSMAGKMFFLQFAGVNQTADVWVNGTHLGQHKGGYSRFRFKAPMNVGQDNVIAVKVNNAHDPDVAPQSADYTFFGGIYRNVSLHVVDPLQVRMLDYAGPGVYLRQRNVSSASATVDVTTKLWNNHSTSRSVTVRTVVTNAAGTVVADTTSPTFSMTANSGSDRVQTVTIANPRRWNGVADPYMYRAHVEVRDVAANRVTDVVTERLGLRSFSVDPDDGFFLNGSYLDLHGVNRHQDRQGKGWAITDADHAEDFNLIREIGATSVRLAHYQHDQKPYDLADEMGFVVWAEIPNVNSTTDSAGYTANAVQQMRELIRQNYNHPSIVFWSVGNEQMTDNAAANALLGRLADVVDEEDPDRLSTYASCCVNERGALTEHTETIGYNKYFGWYESSYNNFGAWADNLHANEPGYRISVAEYGAGANTTQHALNPGQPPTTGQWHPEEYQSLYHEAHWKQMKTRPFIWGKYVWNMFDFASDGRNEGGTPGMNDKGLVTHDRQTRKDSFYWYKANWSRAPTLYITSRRWTQRTEAETEVKVYSNAGTVSLTLNGVSLGSRTSSDRIFTWDDVTLQPGTNTVVATATIGGQTRTDTVTWTLSD